MCQGLLSCRRHIGRREDPGVEVGPYRIQLKCDVQPVQHPPRAVPETKKPAYEKEPESLELENLAAHLYLSGVQGQLLELP